MLQPKRIYSRRCQIKTLKYGNKDEDRSKQIEKPKRKIEIVFLKNDFEIVLQKKRFRNLKNDFEIVLLKNDFEIVFEIVFTNKL